MATDAEQTEMVLHFSGVTGTPEDFAKTFLSDNGWQLEASVNQYMVGSPFLADILEDPLNFILDGLEFCAPEQNPRDGHGDGHNAHGGGYRV